MSLWLAFLLLTLSSVFVQGLFSLFEMACVSFNKVRLQYYVSLGSKRAHWLAFLLKKPSRLFGTTMVGINLALQVGSEASRKFYEAIHLPPEWAPVTQVFLVVIMGELVPMFAARRHSEQLAMALTPLMVLITHLLTPVIWALDQFSRCLHFLLGTPKEASIYLSQEEIKMAFESKEEKRSDLNTMASRVFRLKNLTAAKVLKPLDQVLMVSSYATVSEVKRELAQRYVPLVPIYHRSHQNIVAILHTRHLLYKSGAIKALECSRPPWFITKDTSVLQILDQFRRNGQTIAIVLDSSGQAIGILTLDQILEQILGEEKTAPFETPLLYITRTVSASMSMDAFNQQFQTGFIHEPEDSLNDFLLRRLSQLPAKGEVIHVEDFVFTVLEITLRGIKTVSVHSSDSL